LQKELRKKKNNTTFHKGALRPEYSSKENKRDKRTDRKLAHRKRENKTRCWKAEEEDCTVGWVTLYQETERYQGGKNQNRGKKGHGRETEKLTRNCPTYGRRGLTLQ